MKPNKKNRALSIFLEASKASTSERAQSLAANLASLIFYGDAILHHASVLPEAIPKRGGPFGDAPIGLVS